MVQQGRILSSALESHDLAEEATLILERLRARTDARLRVVDHQGRLIADSARPVAPGNTSETADRRQRTVNPELEPPDEEDAQASYPEDTVIYRIGALPARILTTDHRFSAPAGSSNRRSRILQRPGNPGWSGNPGGASGALRGHNPDFKRTGIGNAVLGHPGLFGKRGDRSGSGLPIHLCDSFRSLRSAGGHRHHLSLFRRRGDRPFHPSRPDRYRSRGSSPGSGGKHSR